MNILVSVKNKIATLATPEIIVCGNNDYKITFDFDDEWVAEPIKTARFVYRRSGENKYEDVVFNGNTVDVPVLSNVTAVLVGVYAGELRTTTPAVISCEKSILCGGGTHEEPPENVYNQILDEINELIGLAGSHPTRTDNPHGVTAAQVGAQAQHTTAVITLRADAWEDGSQTVALREVGVDDTVISTPALDSYGHYSDYGVKLTALGAGTLTYTCDSVPDIDVNINISRFASGNAAANGGGSGGHYAHAEPAEDDIPKVFFGSALPQDKTDTVMSFRYISKTKDIRGYCKTKAQGNSSMSYPKKNQTVKLYKDAACTEKLKVDFKGWGKQNKFCFKANWIDLTHARNVVSARLWGDVVKSRSNYTEIPELLRTSPNQGAVDGFPVKVYAGGVYQGRYTLNIPKDAWMANMDDELDTHCILCGENYNSGCFRAEATISGDDWSDEIHDTVPDAIKTRWNEAINFVMNSTDDEFVAGIGNYFDVESLIDYYVFGLFVCNMDGFGKNQLYMTYDGLKWFATVYDMDCTFGTYFSLILDYDYARNEFEDFNSSYEERHGNLLYIRLENLFADNIKARYAELRDGVLSLESIIEKFERFTDIAPPHLVEEDYAETTAGGSFSAIPLQGQNNIQQIRDYIVNRAVYTDELMGYSAEVPLYPIPNATKTYTEGVTATVTNGNYVTVTAPEDITATGNIAVRLYNMGKDPDSMASSNENNMTNSSLNFTLKTGDVLRLVGDSKNLSKIRFSIFSGTLWKGRFIADGVKTDSNGHFETTYTMEQDFSVDNMVIIYWNAGECNKYNFEIGFKLYVNGVRYI